MIINNRNIRRNNNIVIKNEEKFENRIHPHQPRINQKSKNLTKSITDNFLARLEKYKKEQIEKEEELKQNILKDEKQNLKIV